MLAAGWSRSKRGSWRKPVLPVLRRTFASNAELVTHPSAVTPEVLSVRAQSDPSLAAFGSEPLRVWREGSFDSHVRMSIAGRTIDVASSTGHDLRDPSVARGGDVVLVFWRELAKFDYYALATTGYHTYARRFTLDGTLLDAAPILVADDPSANVEITLGTGSNIQLETATTDTADEKLYLADSTENAVVIIDAKTQQFEKVLNVGLFPWGTHIMDSKDNYCH